MGITTHNIGVSDFNDKLSGLVSLQNSPDIAVSAEKYL